VQAGIVLSERLSTSAGNSDSSEARVTGQRHETSDT